MKPNKVRKTGQRKNLLSIIRNVAVPVFIFTGAIIIYFYIYSHPLEVLWPLKQVVFAGNKHLTDEELKALCGVNMHESLVTLSNNKISRQLLKSPWVRSVSLRKEFPGTVSVTIKEAEPFALLDMNKHLFLMDEKGILLEELKGDAIPFLPIITADPFREKAGFSEALNLVKLMNAKGFPSERDNIGITAHKPHELSVEMDGIVVKIGAGRHEEKLEKLIRLEEDIKSMHIPVDYIDLRFENKAIVKPVVEKVIK
jgi:cell division protein FtsQ